MKSLKYCVTILSLILTFGCGSQRITSSWKSKTAQAPAFKKILVLALVKDEERALQQALENHMRGDLEKMGYVTVSAYESYGPKVFDDTDEKTALQRLRDNNVDAIMTIVLLNKKKESYYTPGAAYYAPYGYYYDRFWPYRTTLYKRIYEPGYYVTDTKYYWESNLYDAKTQELLYSAQTNSFDYSSYNQLAHEYGKVIIADMLRSHVLKDLNSQCDGCQ